jgi:polysaccharide transporter, PST family
MQGANYIAPFLILPYLANTLGDTTFGKFALALSISQIFIIIADYGFGLTGPKDTTHLLNDKKKLATLYSTITTIKICLLLASLIFITPIYILASPFKENPEIYFAAYTGVISSAIFPLWIFQGTESLRGAMIAIITGRAISIAGIFLFVKSEADAATAGILFGSSGILAFALSKTSLNSLLEHERFTLPSIEQIKIQLKSGFDILLSNLYINTYTTSNTIILGLLQDPKSAGYLHLAEKFTKVAIFIFQPIVQAFYPKACIAAKISKDALIELNKKFLKFTFPAALATSALAGIISTPVIETFFSNEYREVSKIIQILAILPTINVLAHSLSTLTLVPAGENKVFSKVYLAACCLNLPLFTILSLQFSSTGAAIANLATEIFVLTLLIIITTKKKIYPLRRKAEQTTHPK